MNDEPSARPTLPGRWGLSPRWKVSPACDAVESLDGTRILVPTELAAQLNQNPILPALAAGTSVRTLIAARALVPEYLARGGPPSAEAQDHYLDIMEAVCTESGARAAWPALRESFLAWSGPVLRQPLSAHKAYFPSAPSLCVELLGPQKPIVRFCVDCRDPTLAPWDNIAFARAIFTSRLKAGIDLFTAVSDTLFTEPERFINPYVKYLHPAIEIEPGVELPSAYWNMGSGTKAELWGRAHAVLAALGLDDAKERAMEACLGARCQPELIGHTFETGDRRRLKIYHMFDGLGPEILSSVIELFGVGRAGATLLDAPAILQSYGCDLSRLVWIATAYHPFSPAEETGVKIHFVFGQEPEKLASIAASTDVAARLSGSTSLLVPPLPETIKTPRGKDVALRATTASFMLVPSRGLTKITLYVAFGGP